MNIYGRFWEMISGIELSPIKLIGFCWKLTLLVLNLKPGPPDINRPVYMLIQDARTGM